jgi:hypothetical protein
VVVNDSYRGGDMADEDVRGWELGELYFEVNGTVLVGGRRFSAWSGSAADRRSRVYVEATGQRSMCNT